MAKDRFLRWPEVHQHVGLCRSYVHNLVQKGKFPKPVKLGARASGWLESEVHVWIEHRVAESRDQEDAS